MKRVYLASPYSYPDAAVRKDRFQRVCKFAAIAMKDGLQVFSPVAHSHSIVQHVDHKLLMDHDFWMAQNLPFLKHWATQFWILGLDGWAESKGIAVEREEAYRLRLPVYIWSADGTDFQEETMTAWAGVATRVKQN